MAKDVALIWELRNDTHQFGPNNLAVAGNLPPISRITATFAQKKANGDARKGDPGGNTRYGHGWPLKFSLTGALAVSVASKKCVPVVVFVRMRNFVRVHNSLRDAQYATNNGGTIPSPMRTSGSRTTPEENPT